MLRHTLTVAGVVVALLAVPMTAWADGWGTANCSQAPTPQCHLEVGASPSPQSGAPHSGADIHEPSGGGDGGSGNLPTCAYARSEYQGHPSVGGSGWWPPGTWYEGTCSLTGVIRNPRLVPQLTAAEVAELARAQLGLPVPALAADPARDQLVHLPTWLWLVDGWEVVTATASVPGISVTATARPASVSWRTGDGSTVTCTGPGTRFRPGADPRASSPDCGHTYRRSSAAQPGGTYLVQATVHWSVSWSGGGQFGTFPEMTTSSTTRFRVTESPALNARPGPR